MTDTRSDTVSVVDRTRPIAAGAPVVAAHFLGITAVFVLGEEAMLFAEPEGEPQRVAVHSGAILATAADGERVVSGGDDGRVVATNSAGETHTLASDPKHRWIDHVALAPDGAVAWSAGKTARPSCGRRKLARIRSSFDRRRTGFSTQGLSPCHRSLQRRYALVSQCPAGRAGKARMEGLASRRHRQVPMAAFWSPPCRSRCCTAGGSPTASICACPATRRG